MSASNLDRRISMINEFRGRSSVNMTVFRVGGFVTVVGSANANDSDKMTVNFHASPLKSDSGIELPGHSYSGDDFESIMSAVKAAEEKVLEIGNTLHENSLHEGARCDREYLELFADRICEEDSLERLLFDLAIRPHNLDARYLRVILGFLSWSLRNDFGPKKTTLRSVVSRFGDEWRYEVLEHALLEVGIEGSDEEITEQFRELSFEPDLFDIDEHFEAA